METSVASTSQPSRVSLSRKIHDQLVGSGITIASAESCTGGEISAAITSVSGCSDYFQGGICVYTEESKMKFLGVKAETLEKYTVYSEQVVKEMVIGTCAAFGAEISIATSGVAGPCGGTDEIPVGTIWIAVGTPSNILTYKCSGDAGRLENIRRATDKSLQMLSDFISSVQLIDEE